METLISPLDGRYAEQIKDLAADFSDEELNYQRIRAMYEHLNLILSMVNIPPIEFPTDSRSVMQQKVTEIEKVTRHDVKAVEYYLRDVYNDHQEIYPYIHFGLTSNDVNSVAYSIMLKNGSIEILGKTKQVMRAMGKFAVNYPMLSHTHGQPATPTTFKYTINVFLERLSRQFEQFRNYINNMSVKYGGATGGLNTFYLIDPKVDWRSILDTFLMDKFELKANRYTTQIDHYDNFAELFDNLRRINVIFLDFVTDMWQYISMGYIKQIPVAGEVGSSTMPHKVNPIQMENAEGNIHMSNSLLQCFSLKLPNSRMQRDLSDSTILRNIGVAYGHSYLAMQSILSGLTRYKPDEQAMLADLDKHWEILAEAVQTVLRWEGKADAYELLKEYTRNNKNMNKESYIVMVNELPLSAEGKEKLLKLTPASYLPGYE